MATPARWHQKGVVVVADQLDCVVEVCVIQPLLGEVDGPGACEQGGDGHGCGEGGPGPL